MFYWVIESFNIHCCSVLAVFQFSNLVFQSNNFILFFENIALSIFQGLLNFMQFFHFLGLNICILFENKILLQ